MRRYIPALIIIILLISSCSGSKASTISHSEISAFLQKHGVLIDSSRPYYNSQTSIPEIFDTVWEMRNIISKSALNIDIEKYKNKQCSIFMYPVTKLPLNIKKVSEARAVIICCGDSIVCSYIEFISELRTNPPVTLEGKSLVDISGTSWNVWKSRLDSDGDKHLVIWKYYEALKHEDYEGAYWFVYDKAAINKQDFVKVANENKLPNIDFLEVEQYKKPTDSESYFLVKAMINGQGNKKKKYEITFDLKKDPKEKEYSGWKIYKTKIK